MHQPSLRFRQSESSRAAILAAAAKALWDEDPTRISLREVAEAAGVSVRTLYRYYPSRDELFMAAAELVVDRLGWSPYIDGPDEIVRRFLEVTAACVEHPHVARTLMRTVAADGTRGARGEYVAAIAAAMAPLVSHLPDRAGREATAMVAQLYDMATWIPMCDESGLSEPEAIHAVAWAMELLLAELRRGGGPSDAATTTQPTVAAERS